MKRILMMVNTVFALLFLGLFLQIQPVEVQATSNGLTRVTSSTDLNGMTAGDEYELVGRSGLIALAEYVNAGNGLTTSGVTFILTLEDGESTVDGAGLTPIGKVTLGSHSFQGLFDGNGVVIENLSPTTDGGNDMGLFGLTEGATVQNVTISGVTIDTNFNRSNVGSVVGKATNSTIISGVKVLGDITIKVSIASDNIAGLVGSLETSSLIINSNINAGSISITGQDRLSGFVGSNNAGFIRNSFLTSEFIVLTGRNSLGVFVGDNTSNSAEITSSHVIVSGSGIEITGSRYLGGFIGSSNSTGSIITNSYLAAVSIKITIISGGVGVDIGGFIGQGSSKISNTFLATSGISMGGTNGPFVGPNQQGVVINSFYNSPTEWIKFNEASGSGLSEINADSLLSVINGSGAFEISNEISFPKLKNMGNQSNTVIYWQTDQLTTSIQDLDTKIAGNSGIYLLGRSGLEALAEFVNRGSGLFTSGITFDLFPDTGNRIDGSGLKPIGHTPISGGQFDLEYAFYGLFNGNNIVIENLNVSPVNIDAERDGLGLFGHARSAIIQNLIIDGIEIQTSARKFIGGLVGYSYETIISGVGIVGDLFISGTEDNYGGLVGSNNSGIINYSFISVGNLQINGKVYLGGMVGINTNGIINNTYLKAEIIEITSSSSNIGGFVGTTDSAGSLISNSYLSAISITLSGFSNMGGFAGSGGAIENVFMAASGVSLNASATSNPGTGFFLRTIDYNSNTLNVNSYFNTGLIGNKWQGINPTGTSDIQTIDGASLLDILNADDDAFEVTGDNFPTLKNLSNQSLTPLFWELDEAPESGGSSNGGSGGSNNGGSGSSSNGGSGGSTTPPPTSPSQGFPTTGTPVIRPVIRELFIEVSDVVVEYGEAVQLPSVIAYEQFGFVRTDLSDLVVQTGSVGSAPGVYTITYSVTYGGQTKSVSIQVVVEDNTPPVLTYTGPISLYAGQAFTPSFSASDNTGDDVTIKVIQDVDPSIIGTQTLIAEATDSSGNTTTVEVKVTVLADTVSVRTLQINNQQLLVVSKESELNQDTTQVFVALATTEPSASSTVWMPYTNQSFTATAPNQRVYLKLQDDAGNVIIRSSAPLFYQSTPVTTTPTLPIVPEASANNTLLMIGVTTTSLVAASAAGWWFLIGKKRKQKEEDNK